MTVTVILWCAAWLERVMGTGGAVTGLILGGLADAHSAIVGTASLVAAEELDHRVGMLAILGALGTNTLAKLLVAGTTGGARYVLRLAPGLLLMWLAGAAVVMISLSSSTEMP